MEEEGLIADLIEDFDHVSILQSARHRLLVVKKNIINIKKEMEVIIRKNKDSKDRVDICQTRLDFVNDDIRSIEGLKRDLEAKLTEFPEYVNTEELPIVFHIPLELFIDQKVEYYSNHVVRHRALTVKKSKINRYLNRLLALLEDVNKNLVVRQQLVDKYDNWIPELTAKKTELLENINNIENDIVAILAGRNSYVREVNGLLRRRYVILQKILEDRTKALMQLNGFSDHIQNGYDNEMLAIRDVKERINGIQEEIDRARLRLERTNIDLQTVEMKSGKVEQQVFEYIRIQNELNFAEKRQAYYDLIAIYEQERENAQAMWNTFQEKNINEILELSALESNHAQLQEEERHMELHVASLLNDNM